MNAENSVDLFLSGRMGTISEGVTSLLEGRDPAPPPSSRATFVLWALLFGVVALQLRGIVRWIAALRRGHLPRWSRTSAPAHRALARLQPRLGGPRSGPRAEAARLVTLRRRSGTARSRLRPSAQRTASLSVGGSSERSGRTRRSEPRPAVTAIPGPQRPAPSRASHEHPRLPTPGPRRRTSLEHASTVRRETAVFLIAVGVVGLHIVDDNFLQPEPGTSAGDQQPTKTIEFSGRLKSDQPPRDTRQKAGVSHFFLMQGPSIGRLRLLACR